MIKQFFYSFRQALKQMFRHKVMAGASVVTITLMLLILALFFFLTVNISFATESLKAQFNTIEVFLLDTTSEDEAQVMIRSLSALSEVQSVEYIDKAQAMEEFKVSWGDKGYLLDGLATNPLPNSLRVTLGDIADGDFVAQICQTLSGVEEVRYYQSEVMKILRIAEVLQKGAMAIIIFLVVVSIFVVYNTIRVNVISRQEEIHIMKVVGATNWFVRGPLLAEGVIIGIISAGLALFATNEGYRRIFELFNEQVQVLFSTGLVPRGFMMENLIWIFVALGICIGSTGSILAVRRFLKV